MHLVNLEFLHVPSPTLSQRVFTANILAGPGSGKERERAFRVTLQETYCHAFETSLWSFSLSSFHNGTTPPGCHSFDDHLSPNQDGGKSKNVVNLGAIRQGMKRFQFLLNCCEPGTIPDASVLAAALDLVSYRVLSAPSTFMLATEESMKS